MSIADDWKSLGERRVDLLRDFLMDVAGLDVRDDPAVDLEADES